MRISDWSSDVCSSDLKPEQQAQGFVVDALLGIVQVPAGALGDQALATRRIGAKAFAQAARRARVGVVLQCLPCIHDGAQAPNAAVLSSIRCRNWRQDFANAAAPPPRRPPETGRA